MTSNPTPTATPTRLPARARPRSGWLAITGLVLLSALPVLGGVLRLGEVTSESAASNYFPVMTVGHILAMSVFCVGGAFQFSPALRLRHTWHRLAGRVLISAGFIAALSGLWLGLSFSGIAGEFAIAMVRLVFISAMTGFLVLAVMCLRRRDFAAHGAWLSRAYAVAVSGGTQALVSVLWYAIVGEDADSSAEALLVAAGFVINCVAAEVIIVARRRASRALIS